MPANRMNPGAWERLNAAADAMDVSIGTLCERMHMTEQAATLWRRRGGAPEVVALAAEMLLVRDRAALTDDPVIAKSALRLPAKAPRKPVISSAEKRRRAAMVAALVRSVRAALARGEPIQRIAHQHAMSERRVSRIAEHVRVSP